MTSFSSDPEANPLEKEVTVAISPFFFFGSLFLCVRERERESECVREKKEWSESGKRDEAARECEKKSKKGKINNGITVRLKSFVIYPNI